MVHNRTCGCQNCFHINYPERVNPHGRTVFFKPSVTNHIEVKKTLDLTKAESYVWIRNESVTFYTKCWWCGKSVFFHRNTNGGCVLFDDLVVPWPVHSCWLANKKTCTVAEKALVSARIEEMRTINITNYEYLKNTASKRSSVRGFVIGINSAKRILPDPKSLSRSETFLKYMVFRTSEGTFIKVLVPESDVSKIIRFSYSMIDVEYLYKNETLSVCCLKYIKSVALDGNKNEELNIDYNYEQIIKNKWTIQ